MYLKGTIIQIHLLLFHSCFISRWGYLPLQVRSSWSVLPPRQEHVTSPLAERRQRSWQPPLFTLHRDSSPKWKKTRIRRMKPIKNGVGHIDWKHLKVMKGWLSGHLMGVFRYFCLKTTSTNTWTTQSIFKCESSFFSGKEWKLITILSNQALVSPWVFWMWQTSRDKALSLGEVCD